MSSVQQVKKQYLSWSKHEGHNELETQSTSAICSYTANKRSSTRENWSILEIHSKPCLKGLGQLVLRKPNKEEDVKPEEDERR